MRSRSNAFIGLSPYFIIHDPGKTLSLIYLLVLRLSQERPTFYQMRPNEMYLFCENGVYHVPIHSQTLIKATEFVDDCTELDILLHYVNGPILLIDSNESLNKLPALFCENYLPIFIVQAASPAVQ